MADRSVVGAKRPLANQNGSDMPRKRFADADDELIEDQFDTDPIDDDFDEPPVSLEEVEDNLGEAGKNWQRPPPPTLDPSKDRLVFQQLEVDYTSSPPNQQYYTSDLLEVPILRMFGVNELGEHLFPLSSLYTLLFTHHSSLSSAPGNSVAVFVHGFEPYFYVEAPTATFSPDDCIALAEVFNVSYV